MSFAHFVERKKKQTMRYETGSPCYDVVIFCVIPISIEYFHNFFFLFVPFHIQNEIQLANYKTFYALNLSLVTCAKFNRV